MESFDPTSKGYQRIDTTLVPLFIAVRNLTPYLDGYKMTIEIANPYNMTFDGFQVSCNWGTSFKYSKGAVTNYAEVAASQKKLDERQTAVLASGWWNPVELTITPATAEEIKNVWISIKPDAINLHRKPEVVP